MSKSKPKTNTPTARGVKATTVHVSRLGEALKSRGLRLKDSELIEIAAHAFGFRDGNTLAAAQKAGQLTLSQPSVAERIRLATGERLIVLADPAETGLFAISRELLAGTARATVVAAPSGRLVDVSVVEADPEDACWDAATADGEIQVPLHAAIVHHRHGYDTFVAFTQTDLDRQLAEYCRNSWSDVEVKGDPDPDAMGDEAVISAYFAALGDESEEYLDSGVYQTRVTPAALAALARSGRPIDDLGPTPQLRQNKVRDPLTLWRGAVASGATELGFDAWRREQPRDPVDVPPGTTRQFRLDPADLAVVQAVTEHCLATGNPGLPSQSWALIASELRRASAAVAGDAVRGSAVISLTDYEADALREAMKAYSLEVGGGAIVPPGDPVSYGYSLERMIEQLAFDEPVIYLTNGCCENAHGDEDLFERLGLTADRDDDLFHPLTKDEQRWIFEDSLPHARGEILMAYTGLYRGQKYLMPVLTLYHDAEDDATNEANAEYIERIVMPQITPGVERLGGLVRFERDDEDDRHSLQILLPVSATRGCAGYDAWCDRVRAILAGADVAKLLATPAPEPFAYVDSRTNAVIAMGEGDLPALGTAPVLKDPASRRIAGRVIGHRTVGKRRDALYRIETRDGAHPEPGPLVMMPQELEPAAYMTLAEARSLKSGDRLISLVEGIGDVDADDEMMGDGETVEREYAPGDWLTVESVETFSTKQGFAVTVVAENGVCNVFDEADYGGRYPFLRPAV